MNAARSTCSAGGRSSSAARAIPGNFASEKFSRFHRSKTERPSSLKNASMPPPFRQASRSDKNHRLMDGDHGISCKMDGTAIGLNPCSVKKARAGQQFGASTGQALAFPSAHFPSAGRTFCSHFSVSSGQARASRSQCRP